MIWRANIHGKSFTSNDAKLADLKNVETLELLDEEKVYVKLDLRDGSIVLNNERLNLIVNREKVFKLQNVRPIFFRRLYQTFNNATVKQRCDYFIGFQAKVRGKEIERLVCVDYTKQIWIT